MATLVRPRATSCRISTSRSVRPARPGGRRTEGSLREVAAPGAQQCGHQRGSEDREQGTVGLGGVAARTVEGDADDLVAGAGRPHGDLVFHRDLAEEVRVQAQLVETPAA